ncbi:MAG: hypothetical protein MRERV_3c109 [Mycoplasmataceae bacterium RV_VA103A]|nr:MAG: hypothetical protein MRERV_3c109 [Mycoplasmataceae bacterium RV_VA103A]
MKSKDLSFKIPKLDKITKENPLFMTACTCDREINKKNGWKERRAYMKWVAENIEAIRAGKMEYNAFPYMGTI